MIATTLTQSPATIPAKPVVREYSLTIVNRDNDDRQFLTAAFEHLPTSQDWNTWLEGWQTIGYKLQSQPQLIQTLD